MQNLLFYLLLAVCFSGCKNRSETTEHFSQNVDSLRTALLNVDKSWSEASLQDGYYHSRVAFAADSAIELVEGDFSLIGIDAIKHFTEAHPDSNVVMQWKPLRAEVAVSGDLGYTFGSWIMKEHRQNSNDTTYYGDYMTVWKKQKDGSWKFVLDGGTNTPKPK